MMKLIKELLPYIIAIYQKDNNCMMLDCYLVEHRVSYPYTIALLNQLCFQYGCSLKERQRFAISLLRIRQKIPILISERGLLLFPTMNIHSKECIWLMYGQIMKVKKHGFGCMVYFKGGAMMYLPMDVRSVKRQMPRCKTIEQFIS